MTNLRFALRQLLKNPGFTAVAVLTLALGFGANTAFFSVLYGAVLRGLPYPDSDRLVELGNRFADDSRRDGRLSLAEFFDYRERQRSFTGIGGSISGRTTVTSEQGADRVPLTYVTANLFPILGVAPARGRGFLDAEEHAGEDTRVLVSHDFWQASLGGAEDVLGRTLRLNGVEHQIIGVMPAGFSYPAAGISLWKPLDLNRRGAADRNDHSIMATARLTPGISPAQARRDLLDLGRRLQADHPEAYPKEARWSLGFEPLRLSQFGHLRAPLGLLATAASAVLLIGCVNVSIMFLLRAAARHRETMVRFALGATRGHLIRQSLVESAVVCGLGALSGMLLAGFGVQLLKTFSPEQIPRLQAVGLDGVVMLVTGGVLMLVTVIVGLAPAASMLKPSHGSIPSLRTSDSRSAARLRDALTVVEIALAVVLLVSAGLTLRSLHGLLKVDLGFGPGRLFTFKTNLTGDAYPDLARANQFYDQLTAKITGLPGVTAVGSVSYLPLSGEAQFLTARKETEGAGDAGGAATVPVGWRVVRGAYFEAMKMTLQRGRLFTATDRTNTPLVAIVDDAFARRFWPGEDAALGQHIRFGEGANAQIRTIVGVVHAVKHFGPGKESLPEAYVPQAQVYQRGMYTVVATDGVPMALASQIRAKLAEVDASVPMYFIETLERRYLDALTLPRFTAGLVGAFSALSLVLAGVGIFGVTAYSVGQRSREFGIRFSLGAQRSHVAGLVLRRVGWLALFGVALGVCMAFGVAKLMASLLFGVVPADLPTLVATAVAMGITVLAGSLVPLLRALRVNPTEALRSE
ncbi:MAG TPA: ABC transporter permease [Candidatus Limnocylindria bacterium]|nr:ABC transporter permease [Candidatus Limnocylindria bacterium]